MKNKSSHKSSHKSASIPNTHLSTPILFLIFKRPDLTRQVFSVIRDAQPSRLYIATDGPRQDNSKDIILCDSSRALVKDVVGTVS